MKKLLIPNGNFHDIPLIKKAKEMGFYVITSGAAPELIGHKYADEYVYGDFSDKELMLKIAIDKRIDAVCSNCNDLGFLSSCYIAEKMGLPGHESYEAATILHHKDTFKKMSKELGLLSPVAESFDNIEVAKDHLRDVTYPIVVKPVDLGAGQGINKADDYNQALTAVNIAIAASKAKVVVIEPFMEGTSHSFNAFIVGQKVASYYCDNEYMFFSKYRISTSASPADNTEKTAHILVEQTEKVARHLNLPDGLLHSQYILDKNGVPHILEITRRMSGDWYPYPQMRATNIDWVEYIVKSQVGIDCSDFPQNVKQKGCTGRHCLNGRKTGIVKKILIHQELKKHVYDSVMWLGEGYEVKNIEKDYPGIIFFEFDSKEKMISCINNIEDFIQFEYL